MDLHIHTPASSDYQEPNVTYLDILHQAELRGLDIIAFTDHNTVAGYAALRQELQNLLLLEELQRIQPDEKYRLDEYRRLLDKILILPGFEFTATFGFHIIGVFPQETSISVLEHLLLTLNVPPDLLKSGSSTVGSTSDVLTAYRVINEAGGIVIAAHANSSNGVAMRGFDFGGQTRIAYTQDPNLHVLEVTDLDKRGRYTTQRFFSGSKTEYPRPMRCIQGSDAHRLVRDTKNPKLTGIGDRITEILLPEVSFAALAQTLKSNDLALTRPFHGQAQPLDFVQTARESGESIVQVFRPSMTIRGGFFDTILQDVCGMANTNGGTIYIGVASDPKVAPAGVREPEKATKRLNNAIQERFSPVPEVTIDRIRSQGKNILRVAVELGDDLPYSLDENQIFVRDETETNLAVRDEIVRLVERGLSKKPVTKPTTSKPGKAAETVAPVVSSRTIPAPRTGVEIVDSTKRNGKVYHTVRDLRNNNLIQNVTRQSARKLWHYAIKQTENGVPSEQEITWNGDIALLNKRTKDNYTWYDLAMRENDTVHIYYGVTDNGLSDEWLLLLSEST
ncbi:MAG: putative DNA binding domain-containing protein [Anaerolineae bacterium]|nr:putative DNA binding domain-containing protein [Anaerolineae bacterium]